MQEASKHCRKCDTTKPSREFGACNRNRDGLQSWCRRCRSAHGAANRDKRQKYIRAYTAANHERLSAEWRAYYVANREKRLAYLRSYYRANRDGLAQKMREYRVANRDALAAYYTEWRAANQDKRAECERRRTARRWAAQVVSFTVEQLASRLAYYGHRCWMCGAAADAVDHVKPLAKGGAHMLANLRPACKRCNSTKKDKWPLPARVAA